MSRKALHHHYTSASRADSENNTALHNSSGSNASTESGEDEIDIKWSDRGYTMEEIVDQFSLPLIVRCQTGGRSIRTSLPIPFSISQEHILLFAVGENKHLVATNINEPTGHKLNPEHLHNDVTIPEDFNGLFVRPYTTKDGSELKAHQNIDSLVKSGSKGFLTLEPMQGILSKSSQSGSNSHSNNMKISYPSRSLFLIEEIQNWSSKLPTGHHGKKALPFIRTRSVSSNKKLEIAHNSRTIASKSDRSSYPIAPGSPTTISPPRTSAFVPFRRNVNIKENEDVLIKTVEDDDVFPLDKSPQLGVSQSPRSRSSSAGSKQVLNTDLFAKCKDSTGRFVFFPLSTTGLFIQIYNHPTIEKKLSLTVRELINSDTFPSIITFVHGKKLRLLTASGFLKPKKVETHRSVLACSLGKTSFVFFEVPMESPMKFGLSLNKGLLNTSRIRAALRLCENKGSEFATDMKVIIRLSPGPPRKESKRNSTESPSKLEDIAEEEAVETDGEESNDSNKEISELTKDYADLSIEGIIYI